MPPAVQPASVVRAILEPPAELEVVVNRLRVELPQAQITYGDADGRTTLVQPSTDLSSVPPGGWLEFHFFLGDTLTFVCARPDSTGGYSAPWGILCVDRDGPSSRTVAPVLTYLADAMRWDFRNDAPARTE